MIAAVATTLFTALAAPPNCVPQTVVTTPGVPVGLQTNCDQAGTVAIVTPPIGGALAGLPGQYTPFPGFHGTDHLLYTVTNAGGETSQETALNIVVNTRPVCADGTATTEVNTPLKLTFPCTDADGGSVLIRAEDGVHGVLDPDVGTEFTYTPEAGFVGEDQISYVGLDGAFQTPTRTLTITVTPAATATPAPTTAPAPLATATPTPPPPPPADRTAPKLTVKAGKASIAKGVTLALESDEPATAKITLTAGKNTATKSAKLTRGTTKVVLKLSAKARKALKRTVKATLTVVATDAAGNRTTRKLSVRLKP
jgi:hypothetical protein